MVVVVPRRIGADHHNHDLGGRAHDFNHDLFVQHGRGGEFEARNVAHAQRFPHRRNGLKDAHQRRRRQIHLLKDFVHRLKQGHTLGPRQQHAA